MEHLAFNNLIIEKSMLLDILLAIVLGFAIGFEREITNKWAGLRTHMLVCLGSCIFTLLSIHAFPVFAHSPQADPARIAAQILTGIGFIGGGAAFLDGFFILRGTNAPSFLVLGRIGAAFGGGGFFLFLNFSRGVGGAPCFFIHFFKKIISQKTKKTRKN